MLKIYNFNQEGTKLPLFRPVLDSCINDIQAMMTRGYEFGPAYINNVSLLYWFGFM